MHNSKQDRVGKRRFQERLHVLHATVLHGKFNAHLPAALHDRWTARHWLHASLFATIGALAATIVPGFSNVIDIPRSNHSIAPLPLPPLAPNRQQPLEITGNWKILRVKPGQTLGTLFGELGIASAVMYRVLQHPGTKNALTRLQPDTEIAFDLGQPGELRGLRFDRDDGHRVQLQLFGDTIGETITPLTSTTHTVVISGQIARSLYASAAAANLPPSAITLMTDEIFKYDIDFEKDLQPGDRFSVLLEETWREGERTGNSKVLAATFTTGGKTYTGFRFERNGKPAEYFDLDGRPLKKTFIRMPVAYSRISSTFGTRKHPVLGTMRMHKGIDYAAASGTAIMAAGDGRVTFIGTQHGYGHTVILDHGKGYSTLYGHMSRFGKIKTGQSIAQGTVIGYVGMSGLATGPHLHYEFRVAGVQRNPVSITMPPPEPLRGSEWIAFRAHTAPAMARIETMEKTLYANTNTPGKRTDRG